MIAASHFRHSDAPHLIADVIGYFQLIVKPLRDRFDADDDLPLMCDIWPHFGAHFMFRGYRRRPTRATEFIVDENISHLFC